MGFFDFLFGGKKKDGHSESITYIQPKPQPRPQMPKRNEVRSFIETIKQNPAYGKSAFFGECEKHVKSVLAECEDTLSKY